MRVHTRNSHIIIGYQNRTISTWIRKSVWHFEAKALSLFVQCATSWWSTCSAFNWCMGIMQLYAVLITNAERSLTKSIRRVCPQATTTIRGMVITFLTKTYNFVEIIRRWSAFPLPDRIVTFNLNNAIRFSFGRFPQLNWKFSKRPPLVIRQSSRSKARKRGKSNQNTTYELRTPLQCADWSMRYCGIMIAKVNQRVTE